MMFMKKKILSCLPHLQYYLLGMTLKIYSSVANGMKLKVRKFWGLIRKFEEVIG